MIPQTQQALGPIYLSLEAGLPLTFRLPPFFLFLFRSPIYYASYFVPLAVVLGPPSCACCPCPGTFCQISPFTILKRGRSSSGRFIWIGER